MGMNMDDQQHKIGTMGGMVLMGVIALIAHLFGDSAFYTTVSILVIIEFVALGYEMNKSTDKPKRKNDEYFTE